MCAAALPPNYASEPSFSESHPKVQNDEPARKVFVVTHTSRGKSKNENPVFLKEIQIYVM